MSDNDVVIGQQEARNATRYRAAKARADAAGVELRIVDDPGYKEPPQPVILATRHDLSRAVIYRLAKDNAAKLGAEIQVAADDVDYAQARIVFAREGRMVYAADGKLLP